MFSCRQCFEIRLDRSKHRHGCCLQVGAATCYQINSRLLCWETTRLLQGIQSCPSHPWHRCIHLHLYHPWHHSYPCCHSHRLDPHHPCHPCCPMHHCFRRRPYCRCSLCCHLHPYHPCCRSRLCYRSIPSRRSLTALSRRSILSHLYQTWIQCSPCCPFHLLDPPHPFHPYCPMHPCYQLIRSRQSQMSHRCRRLHLCRQSHRLRPWLLLRMSTLCSHYCPSHLSRMSIPYIPSLHLHPCTRTLHLLPCRHSFLSRR